MSQSYDNLEKFRLFLKPTCHIDNSYIYIYTYLNIVFIILAQVES